MRKTSLFTLVLAALICFTWGPTSKAQEEPSSVGVDASSTGAKDLEKLRAKRAEIDASTALPDPVKKSTLTYLNQAISFCEQAVQIQMDAESFAQTLQRAPKRTKEIEEKLKSLKTSLEPDEVSDESDEEESS